MKRRITSRWPGGASAISPISGTFWKLITRWVPQQNWSGYEVFSCPSTSFKFYNMCFEHILRLPIALLTTVSRLYLTSVLPLLRKLSYHLHNFLHHVHPWKESINGGWERWSLLFTESSSSTFKHWRDDMTSRVQFQRWITYHHKSQLPSSIGTTEHKLHWRANSPPSSVQDRSFHMNFIVKGSQIPAFQLKEGLVQIQDVIARVHPR